PSRWNCSLIVPTNRSAYARQARQKSATDMSRFFGPSSRSTRNSIGRPWQSYPTTYGASNPAIERDLTTSSFRILFSAVPMWMLPLAYGGPSCSTNFGAPARRSRIFPYRSIACQRASVSGSLVGRFAFIGNSVRGRLTVSFHSGMGIQRFYNDPMRLTRLDNGLKVLIQEEHTAPLASVWCWYKVGSKDERPGLTGVSHWCEHMNFKGTT